MSRNPYAAPETTVADPVAHLSGRPKEVTYAVRLQWLSVSLSVISAFIFVVQQLQSAELAPLQLVAVWLAFAFALGQCLLLVWLTLRVAAGRGWARWILLAAAVLGVLMVLPNLRPLLAQYWKTPWVGVLDAVNLVVGFVLIGLLFMPRATAWFAACRDA